MICTYIELGNYGGIYNGLHLNRIFIDFRKAKHKVILLKGDSGSGKSTIIESISPLPEDNGYFIPELPAYKHIGYLDELTGITYDIQYVHDVRTKSNGEIERTTTKGYIKKTFPDGTSQELNPTGNITPCKEMIYSEFELDPNFIALTKMNTTDKGLVDKTPAARKAYVNSILSVTQAYNEMYKTINKKATAYKDRIKRISTKIDTIGNPEKIAQTLQAVETRINKINNVMELLTSNIAKADAVMKAIDAKGTVSTRYNEIKTRLTQISHEIAPLTRDLTDAETKVTYEEIVRILNEAIPNINAEISKCDVRNESLLKDREYDSKSLEEKMAKLEACGDSNLELIQEEYEKINHSIADVDAEIDALGTGFRAIVLNNCSPDLFDRAADICRDLRSLLLNDIPHDVVNYLLNNSDSQFSEMEHMLRTTGTVTAAAIGDFGSIIPDNLVSCTREEAMTKSISQIDAEYTQYQTLLSTASLLKKRPSTCNDETCPFIANAVLAQKDIDSRGYTPEEYEAEVNEWHALATMINLHNQAKRYSTTFFSTIAKKFTEIEACRQIFDYIGFFTNDTIKSACIKIFTNDFSYDMTNIERAYDGVTNIFTLRSRFVEQLRSLDGQMSDYKTHNALYAEISNDIEKLQGKIASTIEELNSIEEQRQVHFNKLNKANAQLYDAKRYLSKYEDYEALTTEKEALEKEKETIETDAVNYNEQLAIIDKATKDKCSLATELSRLDSQRSELNYNSRMIATYQDELNQINNEYRYIDLIKYYTASNTGIQTIFAAMYMNDITIQANKILGGLFNGELTLMPFIINESEFKIPVAVRNGFDMDDVKSLSGGQTALVSMIISFALVHKSSSKLNILTADELDGPLDPALRRQFIHTLYTVLEMVGSNQAILISHNSEMSMSECDIVLLKNDNADGANIDGNIIWSYYNQVD